MECDGCAEDGKAEVEIVLSEGQIFYAHEACIFTVIIDNASKENPVLSIEVIACHKKKPKKY